ncbi:MAG: acetolactate synthase small subunit [Flavobacteriales bacterium]|nr:acetolactate synthase small subunit [Flavobacteriales bacterium]
MSEKTNFTITVFCENNPGLLSRIAGIFSRRKINILSLNINSCEVPSISRMSILVTEDQRTVRKLTSQIAKQVDVIKAYYHDDESIIWQELALFKVSTDIIISKIKLERLLHELGGRLVMIKKDFGIIEVTGKDKEINQVQEYLDSLGIIEYTKSGRVPLFINSKNLYSDIKQFESKTKNK